MRDWLNRNPMVATGVAVLLIAVVVIAVGSMLRPYANTPAPYLQVYFYDLQKRQRFVADETHIPPFLGEDGSVAVRVQVFSCGDCSDPAQQFEGYLERYPEELHAQARAAAGASDRTALARYLSSVADQRELSPVDSVAWVSVDSEAGAALAALLGHRCPGDEFPRPCRPAP